MNLYDIAAFIAVAETGSVSRAAARLNLTQPATTRRIQNFEASVGDMALFDRTVRPAELTEFGQEILEHCRHVMSAVSNLETFAADQAEPQGRLKIGIAHGLGDVLLTASFEKLRQNYPGIRLQVTSDWTSRLIEEVRAGALDGAIALMTTNHATSHEVIGQPLSSEEIVIVEGRRSAALRDAKTLRLRDLKNAAWVLNPAGCGCRTALIKAFGRLQAEPQIAAEVHGEDFQLSLIAQGGLLGIVPLRQLRKSTHCSAVSVLDVNDFRVSATMTLLTRSTAGRFDKVLRALCSDLEEHL